MNAQKPREIAARVLLRRDSESIYTEELFESACAEATLEPVNRRLAQELIFGVVRRQATLDWLIERKTERRTQKHALQVVLRLGLYQLFWLDRVPDHAAIHETVELAKILGCGPQAGFVNAVLRAYARMRDATRQELETLRTEQPAIGYSHPTWLVDRWTQRWGDDQTRALLEWNNQPPRVFARHNALRAPGEKLIERWRAEGVDYDFRTWDWTGENLVFELRGVPPLHSLGSFRDGWFYVQDPSTLLAVQLLDPQPGERVLDRCSAPGGKTTYIAQRMHNQGRIVAQDRDFARLKLVDENAERLGATIVETCRADPVIFPELTLAFDRALADVPCSNTGVLKRRVDLRWRLRPEELKRLRAAQLDILRESAAQVRVGGILVYSTCSLEREENQDVIQEFLAEQPEFVFETERELMPVRDQADGAYVARLRRQEPAPSKSH